MQKIKDDDIKIALTNLLKNKYTEQMYFDYTHPVSHSELICGVHTLGYLYLDDFKDKESREKAICEVLEKFEKVTGHKVEDYKFSSQLTGHGSNIFPHTLEERKFCIALYYLALREALDKRRLGDKYIEKYTKELDIENNPKFGQWIDDRVLVVLLALATKKTAMLLVDMKNEVLVSRYDQDNKSTDDDYDPDQWLYFGSKITDCEIESNKKIAIDGVKSALDSGANIILLRNTLCVCGETYKSKKYFGTNLTGYYQPVRPEKNKDFIDAMIKNFICSDGMFCRNFIIDYIPWKTSGGNTHIEDKLVNNCDKILKIPGIENIIQEAKKLDNANDDLQQEKKYDLLKKIVFRFEIMFESGVLVEKYIKNLLKAAGLSNDNKIDMMIDTLDELLYSGSEDQQKQKEINDFINSLTMVSDINIKNKIKMLLLKNGTWELDYLAPVVASNVIYILESKNISFGANAFQVAEKCVADIFNSKPENKWPAINYFLNQLPMETDKETRRRIKDLVCNIFLDGTEQEIEKWPQNKIFAGLLKNIDEIDFDNISDAEKKLNKNISDLKKDNDRGIFVNEKFGDPDNLRYCPAVVVAKKLLAKDKSAKLDFQALLCLSYLIGIKNNDFDEFNETSLALRKICDYKYDFDNDKMLGQYFLNQIKELENPWHYLDYFWLFKLLSNKLYISFEAFDILKELIPNDIEANFVLRILAELDLKNRDDANKALDFLINKIKETKNYGIDLNQVFYVIDNLNSLDENLSIKLISKLIKSGCISFDINDILKLYGDDFLSKHKSWIETINKTHELIKNQKKEDQAQKTKPKEKSNSKDKKNNSNDQVLITLMDEIDNYFKDKSESENDLKEIKAKLKAMVNLIDTYGAFNKIKNEKDSWIEKIEKADKINILLKIWFDIIDLFEKFIIKLSFDKKKFVSGALVSKLNKLESMFKALKSKVPVINKKNINAGKELT